MENMNYEFKDMATIDVAEEISENAHVLIEDDGVIRRFSKDKISNSFKEESENPNILVLPYDSWSSELESGMINTILSGGIVYGCYKLENNYNNFDTIEPIKFGIYSYEDMGKIKYLYMCKYSDKTIDGNLSKEEYDRLKELMGI